ncbi:very-short-patch-repair endonuclease [Elusimicrobium posterum]|uniref:endonuclease domain-containing protein n=1 Tax=Elusimicrobium posterum TaxID=3116653 RepID=UPI003C78EF1C
MLEYNKNNKPLAKKLRKTMTEAEVILWSRLRRKQFNEAVFIRQKMIGNYIVDFCCVKSNLIIEIDGSGHYTEEEKIKDSIKDTYLDMQGFKVLRFSNLEVLKNLNNVLSSIFYNL